MNWVDQFCEFLFPLESSKLRIEDAYCLKSKNLPEAIFKYRGVDLKGYSLKSLEESTVWLSGPLKFNDPFDSALTADHEKIINTQWARGLTPEVIERHSIPKEVIEEAQRAGEPLDVFLKWIVSTGKSGITKDNVDGFKAALNGAVSRQCDDLRAKLFPMLFEAIKICSFTTRSDSLLMWGHYADQHTGFCIKYSLNNYDGVKDLRLRFLYPVMYSDSLTDMTELLAIRPFKKFNNLWVHKAALTKSKDWEYEREWRLLIGGGLFKDDTSWPFLPPTALYLGARMEPKNEEILMQIAEKMGLEVFKMELSKRKYALLPKKLR